MQRMAGRVLKTLRAAGVPLLAGLPVHSRVQALPAALFDAVPAAGRRVWVKRDDELGSVAAGGSKLRKYISYLASAQARGVRGAVVLGGPQSNNIPAAAALLRQQGIRPFLCLRRPRPPADRTEAAVPFPLPYVGNALLWQPLVPAADVHWVPSDCPIDAMLVHAAEVARRRAAELGGAVDVLPEGANHEDAWAGALLLADDVVANAAAAVPAPAAMFDHVFVDAGTGLTAAALLVGLAVDGRWAAGGPPTVHVVLVASSPAAFAAQVEHGLERAAALLALDAAQLRARLPAYHVHVPAVAGRSFGPGTAAVFAAIAKTARRTGLLLDPIYSGKLFAEAEHLLQQDATLAGDILLIHSGGVPALFGFPDRLAAATAAL